MDAYTTQNYVPAVDVILRAMKALEERWHCRNEWEYGEANHVGRGGGRDNISGWKPKMGGASR